MEEYQARCVDRINTININAIQVRRRVITLVKPTTRSTRTTIIGNHVIRSGSGRPRLKTAQRPRSVSRDLPANKEHTPNLMGTLQSYTALLIKVRESPQPLVQKVNCLRRPFLHTRHGYRCRLTAATHHPETSCRH